MSLYDKYYWLKQIQYYYIYRGLTPQEARHAAEAIIYDGKGELKK